jgi:1,4-alpha-glucan branching enzyme
MLTRKAIFIFLFGIICNTLIINGQVVTSDPVFPIATDSVRIVFHANEGSRGLSGYAGPIWAHTGVITDKSSSGTDWKYVIAGWSQNLDKAKLTPLGNDLWEFKIGPSIRSFYGVPASEKIVKLAFVFRDATGSKTGKMADGSDIFLSVYPSGLNVSFVKPDKEFLSVVPGSSIELQVAGLSADSLVIYLDGIRVTGASGNNLNYSLSAGVSGYHIVEAKAYGLGSISTDSFNYLVKGSSTIAQLPAGVKDGINCLNDSTAVLVLYAPKKEFVFVIGDFTDWKVSETFQMKQTPDSLRYWLEITGLQPLKEYLFQYLVDGEIRIADPYTDKISDPYDDGFIDPATYPGLVAYPFGKTTQATSVLQTGQQPYPWKSSGFSAPPKEKLVIYELLVRDFLKSHTFKSLTDTLSYLKRLGINAIELMPVSEFEGNDSWGYNPSFYFAVDKYYGPKNTFKAFIDSAHQAGIAVIMDMVLNHSYGQSPLVRLYWDTQNSRPASDNPWYNIQSPNTAYSWGYDFNHESPATQRFVDSVNAYWLDEYHVDGFRFDFTKGFTNTPGDGGAYDASRINILKRMYNHVQDVKPGAYVILEHFADNREEKELSSYGMMLWGNSNYNYRKALSSYFLDGKSDFSWISWKERGWTQPGLVGYMESHDEERLMYECYYWGNMTNPQYLIKDTTIALQRMELAANFFIPIPGPKMIWMFGELGYDYSINFNTRVGKKPIRWDYQKDIRRKRLYQIYAALSDLKTSEELFSTADFAIAFADTIKRIQLNDFNMQATILGNFGNRPSLADPNFQHPGWWYEFWTGDSLLVSDVNSKLNFKPGEYRLYTDIRLKKPDILSSTEDTPDPFVTHNGISLYPNPATDRLFICTPGICGSEAVVRLIDMQGRVVMVRKSQGKPDSGILDLDISGLDEGVYLIEVQTDHDRQVARWMKVR